MLRRDRGPAHVVIESASHHVDHNACDQQDGPDQHDILDVEFGGVHPAPDKCI